MTVITFPALERATVVKALKKRARFIATKYGEVSANDLRPTLVRLGYTGDPRIIGTIFNKSEWEPVGMTRTNNPAAHQRLIQTFARRAA